MATAKKVGVLVKEARTAASLTQEKLAKQAGEGLTANDISKCEQLKADLTAAQLKAIAKVCGVTQTSLVNAPKNLSAAAAKKAAAATTASAAKKPAASTAAKKPAATTAAKKPATSTAAKKPAASAAAKKPAASTAAKKPAVPAAANISMKVTSTEQKVIEAYRTASSDNKKLALKLLKGEINDNITGLLGTVTGTSTSGADGLADMLTGAISGWLGKK